LVLPLKAVTQLLRPPILGRPFALAALCRRRLSEGTSAARAQVGFQPVTNPLLEQTESRLLFSDHTPVWYDWYLSLCEILPRCQDGMWLSHQNLPRFSAALPLVKSGFLGD